MWVFKCEQDSAPRSEHVGREKRLVLRDSEWWLKRPQGLPSGRPGELMPMNLTIGDNVCCTPCLVLAGFDGAVAREFRRRGWDVYPARTGPEARRLARMVQADLVVLNPGYRRSRGRSAIEIEQVWRRVDLGVRMSKRSPLIRQRVRNFTSSAR